MYAIPMLIPILGTDHLQGFKSYAVRTVISGW